MSNYCKNCYELTEKLEAKEQECEQEKALKETYLACYKAKHGDITGKLFKYKQTLAEIKPILELYANSKIGEEQLDSTYKITIKESKVLGDTYITFDPRPAKQALQKISEVENDRCRSN